MIMERFVMKTIIKWRKTEIEHDEVSYVDELTLKMPLLCLSCVYLYDGKEPIKALE